MTGFTLIEVLGALVIFSVGILMVMQVGNSLTVQMRNAGARTEIVELAGSSLDSIEAMPLDSLTAGTVVDTMTVQGWAYQRNVVVTSITAVLARVDVTISPVSGEGPSHDVTSYVSGTW
ncbi:MAG: prepilin-type N-terminal cleavage/methylation domain-containing protein [Gemmatimonadota bacterium]